MIFQRLNSFLSLCFLFTLLSSSSFAQYSPSFDSSYRAAISSADATIRLSKLRALELHSYQVSVFQSMDFGKAYLQTASDTKSDSDTYIAYIVLSSAYQRNQDFQKSLSYSLQAIKYAELKKDYVRKIPPLQMMAYAYGAMSLVSKDSTDMQKAIYYCGQAIDIINEHINEQRIKDEEPYLLSTMADLYAMHERYDTAISLYLRAIASGKARYKSSMLEAYINLGISLNGNKEYGKSMAVYATADSIIDAMHIGAYYKLKVASNRANLLLEMGKLQGSEKVALNALAIARQTGAMDVQVDMVEHLKKLYQKQGRLTEALAFSDSLAAIKDRNLNKEKTGQVAEMAARYDAGVKDQQIVGQQLIIRQNRQQKLFLWGGILLLSSVGAAAYVGLMRSRRLNRKITLQQEQLLNQKLELQRVNEMKNQLFSLIGHDVRAPLNSLMAYAMLLDRQGDLPAEKVKKYNTNLRQTLGHTMILMENILQFAKTQMQTTQPYPEIIELREVVTQAVKLLQPAIDQKEIQLETTFDDDTVAFADEDMTEVIVRNLLNNAIKFSNNKGSISISVKAVDDAAICCTIHDNGTGMTEQLVNLWNSDAVPTPVRSTDGTGHEKGTGLGLMLSKTFATMMGGRLEVSSKIGSGSEFSIILPRKQGQV